MQPQDDIFSPQNQVPWVSPLHVPPGLALGGFCGLSGGGVKTLTHPVARPAPANALYLHGKDKGDAEIHLSSGVFSRVFPHPQDAG